MRYRAVEKLEIIRLVEQSPLPVLIVRLGDGSNQATDEATSARHERDAAEVREERFPSHAAPLAYKGVLR